MLDDGFWRLGFIERPPPSGWRAFTGQGISEDGEDCGFNGRKIGIGNLNERGLEQRSSRNWLGLLPLAVVLIIGGFLFAGLNLQPKEIPSVLIGKAVPEFDLPALPNRPKGLKTGDLKGQISLVNVFASWCVSCRAEHPLFMKLSTHGVVPVHGLNYKDEGPAAIGWLRRYGDPYDRVGHDLKGRVGIDWGVYGVPETFLVDAEGRIVCKHIGPVMARDLEEILLPAIHALRQGDTAKC